MKHKLIIIDDFYDDPMKVREQALEMDFCAGGTYPGKDVNGVPFSMDMIRRFSTIMGRPISPSIPTANFRISLHDDKAKRHIHVDTHAHVANVCLALDEDCKGGVVLWKHKETGLEEVPAVPGDLEAKFGFDIDYLENKIVRVDGQDESKFEKLIYVPYKFNRCVILYGKMLHSPLPQGWGDCLENGRLTQHFFFSTV